MPETAVGKNDTMIVIERKIWPPRQTRVLSAPAQAQLLEKGRHPFFNGGILRTDSTHIFAASDLIVNVRHSSSPHPAFVPLARYDLTETGYE